MSTLRPVLYTLLTPLLLVPAGVDAMGGIDDLDVTIRVIDRQNRDVDAFINRIEIPPPQAREAGIESRRDPNPRRDRNNDAGDDRGFESDRDARRNRENRDGRRRDLSDRADAAREFRDHAREDAWDRDWDREQERRDAFREQQSEIRDENRDRRFQRD